MYKLSEKYKSQRAFTEKGKIRLIYTLVIGIGLTSIFIVLSQSENPSGLIIGEWEEQSWEYERVNKIDTNALHYKEISDEVKELIGENLIIHKSETWNFMPDGRLKLITGENEKTVNWKLSGRGNILELKHLKINRESYNISELTDSTLVINFDTDFEVKGIAKLSFVKKQRKNHDLEI